jgi:hypothetical protein
MKPVTLLDRARTRRSTAETPLHELVRVLAARVPQPVEPLEIAAVIESMGITDAAAESTYRHPNVFALADKVFPLVNRRAQHLQAHGSDDPQADSRERAQKGTLDAAVSSLLSLIPLVIVALSTRELARAGFSSSEVVAVTIGVSSAMVALAGPLLVTARQAAIYRGFEYLETADRFVRRGALEMAAVACLIGLFSFVPLAYGFGSGFGALFALSFGGFGSIWVFATSLIALRRIRAVALSVLAGLFAGGIAVVLLPSTAPAVGTICTAVALMAGLARIRHHDGALARPSRRLVAADGAHYAAYGLVLMIFLAEPHVAAGVAGDGLRHFSTFELSFGVALVPLVVAAMLLEKLLYGFWGVIRNTERTLDPVQFASVTFHAFRRKLVLFGGVLGVMSIGGGLALAVLAHDLSFFDRVDLVVVATGLAGFWLFGCAQFVSLLLLNFGRPGKIVTAATAGIVVAIATAIPSAALVGRDAAGVGFVFGAAVFLVLAALAVRNTFEDIDYYYASAF